MLPWVATKRARIFFAVAACVLLIAAAAPWLLPVRRFDPTDSSVTLADIERQVAVTLPVAETTSETVARDLSAGQIVLFDVRTRAEFEQSHLAGAIHVEPDMSGEAFIAKHAAALAGKTPVFYCAVGVRSGVMTERVAKALAARSAEITPLNMRGGIFRWYSEGRPVVTGGSAPARSVHPYDGSWGKLLDRTLQSPRSQSR